MITNTAAYHFVPVEHPDVLASALHAQAGARGLKGTMLVAPEGINLFLAGTAQDIDGFYDWLHADPRFAGMPVKYSASEHQPFARLKAKVKPEIISFRLDHASPLQHGRAPAVSPRTLQGWLRDGHDDHGRPLVLLDTRNQQEVAFGTFAGALTLPIGKFTDLPAALALHRERLAGATVVSFCTGGIRCEKAALWMRADGIDNVVQLDGGILGYFEQVGGEGYEGRCFVFDERVALDPQLRPLQDAGNAGGSPELGKV
ncbi:MAG TPA: sulfurtransferase [Xanthomonadaceae bacterium]|nr:sulfurtransferase [Xanthomonadaceae bacterium]